MMKASIRAGISLLVTVLCLFSMTRTSHAEMEWTEKKQLKLEATPLDMATSPDGKLVIVLTPGELMVYSVPEDKVTDRFPVDRAFDKMTYSSADETVIVSSSSGKMLKFIQLDVVQKFSLAGLPFKGPENAPVTIAVFSDYQ